MEIRWSVPAAEDLERERHALALILAVQAGVCFHDVLAALDDTQHAREHL